MSYRSRRRLLWVVAAGALVVAMGVSAGFFWNTANTVETFSGGKADIFVAPAPHKLTKKERAELVEVALRFVDSAVARNHPERAYELTGPNVRGGLTKKEWATGNIPVIPYPVESARWKVEYSNSEGVGLLVMAFPKKGAAVQPTVFSMAMASVGVGDESRWVVNGWTPRGGGPSVAGSGAAPGTTLAGATKQLERVSPKASVVWLLVPLFLVSLVFFVPVVFLLREQRDARRMRRYLDSRAL